MQGAAPCQRPQECPPPSPLGRGVDGGQRRSLVPRPRPLLRSPRSPRATACHVPPLPQASLRELWEGPESHSNPYLPSSHTPGSETGTALAGTHATPPLPPYFPPCWFCTERFQSTSSLGDISEGCPSHTTGSTRAHSMPGPSK